MGIRHHIGEQVALRRKQSDEKSVAKKKSKIRAKKRFRHLTNVQAVWQDLRTEIELLKSMDHPNICKIYDVFEDKFNLYLVLEHLGGGELYDRIVERNRYHEKDSKPIIKQMLEGI